MPIVELKAGFLKDALAVIVPKKKKIPKRPLPLILHSKSQNKLSIADATYGAACVEIPCLGDAFEGIEVNGYHLKALMESFSDDDMIKLEKNDAYFSVRFGKALIKLARLDHAGRGKTKRKPLPAPLHKGKVEHPPDPTTKRAEYSDTWKFSARVPLPADVYKNRPDDWDKD